MKRSNNKGFTTVELVTIIVAVVVVLAVVIPTVLIVNNKNSELAQMQEKTNQQIADLAAKLEGVQEGLTAEDVQKLLDDAFASLEIPEAGLSEDQVKDIIDTAIKGIKIPSGLTSSQVKKIVADALKGIDTGLTREEIEDIINDALANQPADPKPEDPTEKPDEPAVPTIDSADALNNALAANPLTGELAAGNYNIVLGSNIHWEADTAIVIGEGANVVIDLNGKQLTTANILKIDGGSLKIVNGSLNTTGYIQVKSGSFTAEGAALNLNSTLGLGVQNYTADGIVTIKDCKIVALGGESIAYAVSNVAGGIMTVVDTTIVSNKAIGINNGNGGELTLTNVDMTGTKVCVMTNDAATVINGGALTATELGIMTISAVSGTTTLNGVAINVPEGSAGVISGDAVSGTYTINGK